LYSLIRVAYFLYGALVVTLRTCYGALQIVVLLLFIIISVLYSVQYNAQKNLIWLLHIPPPVRLCFHGR